MSSALLLRLRETCDKINAQGTIPLGQNNTNERSIFSYFNELDGGFHEDGAYKLFNQAWERTFQHGPYQGDGFDAKKRLTRGRHGVDLLVAKCDLYFKIEEVQADPRFLERIEAIIAMGQSLYANLPSKVSHSKANTVSNLGSKKLLLRIQPLPKPKTNQYTRQCVHSGHKVSLFQSSLFRFGRH